MSAHSPPVQGLQLAENVLGESEQEVFISTLLGTQRGWLLERPEITPDWTTCIRTTLSYTGFALETDHFLQY